MRQAEHSHRGRHALAALVAVLAGCSEQPSGQVPGSPAAALGSPGVEACTIALTEHRGTTAADREIERWQARAHSAPDRSDYLERLGWAYVAKARTSYDNGYYKLAEQTALCIEAVHPAAPEALLLQGHVLHSFHRFKEAEAVARTLVASRGLAFDHALLGDVLMEQGKLQEALGAYQAMMDLKPGPQAYSRAAHLRWLKGDVEGAIEMMAMAVQGADSRDAESAAWSLVRLAGYEVQAGGTGTARQLAAAALALQPDYPPALLLRARLLLAGGDDRTALEDLARAATLTPLPEYQWALAEALRGAERPADAEAVERTLAARGASEDPRTYALYLASTGREIDTAVRLAREELDVRADVFTLDTAAWTLQAAGQIEEARALSRRALAEGTQDARLFYHAGVIAARDGDPQQARALLGRAQSIEILLLPSERRDLSQRLQALSVASSSAIGGTAVPLTGKEALYSAAE